MGTVVDYARAFDLARKSAEAGSARGQYVALAVCCSACASLVSSSHDLTPCRYMMGVIFSGGKCGVKDQQIALKHWSDAAAQGDVWSKYRLATMSHLTESVDITAAAAAPSADAISTSSPRRAAAAILLRAQVNQLWHH